MLGLFRSKKNSSVLNNTQRIKGALVGFIVGDALGVPVEFKSREELTNKKVTKMLEYGTHSQPIGTWSDDSSMMLATIDSMVRNNMINYSDIMDCFLEWYSNGKYTPDGVVFDVGNATSLALRKYKDDKNNYLCGSNDINSNGNGSLMRILPISIYLHCTDEPVFDVIKNISQMTHAHIYSVFSCLIYTVFIDEYLKELDIRKAYGNMQLNIKNVLENDNDSVLGDVDDLKSVFKRIVYEDISKLSEDKIKSSGYVVDTLEACLWCVLNSKSYKDAVLLAVNLGNDTDTIGALTGALAGLIYGYGCIPEKWINKLKKREYIESLIKKYILFINNVSVKKEKATAESWNCKDFKKSRKFECNISLTKDEFKELKYGHIPKAMEDHWFMYCDDKSINYYRSWNGIQVFKGYYKETDSSVIIFELEINDNPKEYKVNNDNESYQVFYDLVVSECNKIK